MRVRLYFEGHGTVAGVLELFQALPTTTHMTDLDDLCPDPTCWKPMRDHVDGKCPEPQRPLRSPLMRADFQRAPMGTGAIANSSHWGMSTRRFSHSSDH